MKNIKWSKKLILISLTGVVLVTNPEVTLGCTKIVKMEQNHTEDDVMKYFSKLKDKTTTLIDEGKKEEKVEKNMTTYMDFIFEDKKIKDHTIDELSTDNQNKIKTDFVCLKEYMEEKRPKWYEKLKDVSIQVKDYLKDGYNEIKDQLSEWKEEGTLKENLKEEAKKQWERDKENFKIVWNEAKKYVKKLGE